MSGFDGTVKPDTIKPFDALQYANGKPVTHAVLKQEFADFQVEEITGFTLTGQGDHLCLQLRKTDLTTTELANRIAQVFEVDVSNVGFAGMKDRRAITTQWFSIKKPPRRVLDPGLLQDESVEVLSVTDNARKIHIGSHRGNRFRIRLRDITCPRQDLEQRLTKIATAGVPNYYGAQRFGHTMGNVQEALRLFEELAGGDARPSQRRQHSIRRRMAVSAARAYVFNQVLSRRVADQTWNARLAGEVFNLDGTARCFCPDPDSDTAELDRRLTELDIHPTGPLDGEPDPRGRYSPDLEVLALEKQILQELGPVHCGLLAMGLEASRRALRLAVRELHFSWTQADTMELSFELAAGGYATCVLRECVATLVDSSGADSTEESREP